MSASVLGMSDHGAVRMIRSIKESGWRVSGTLAKEYSALKNKTLPLQVVEAVQSARSRTGSHCPSCGTSPSDCDAIRIPIRDWQGSRLHSMPLPAANIARDGKTRSCLHFHHRVRNEKLRSLLGEVAHQAPTFPHGGSMRNSGLVRVISILLEKTSRPRTGKFRYACIFREAGPSPSLSSSTSRTSLPDLC